MEEKDSICDFIFVALENGKAVATLRISAAEFAKMREIHSLKNLQEFLN